MPNLLERKNPVSSLGNAWLMTSGFLPGRPRIALAPESGAGSGGGEGGGDPPAGSGSPGGDPPGGGGQPSGDKAPAAAAAGAAARAYRPDGLPDQFAGQNDQETIDKLFKAVDGFRREMGDRGALPEKPDGYSFEASDKLKPFVSNFDKDPLYSAARAIAHKSGMTDKVFKAFIPQLLEHMIDNGLAEAPIDASKQLLSLAPESAANLDEAGRTAAASQRVRTNMAWVDGAKAQGLMPEAATEFLAAGLASDPRAHHLVEFLRGGAREVRPAMGGSSAGGMSDADLSARGNDPRNDPRSAKYDRSFAAETDRLYQQRYG